MQITTQANISAECTKSKVVWYGIKRKRADVIAEIINMNANSTKFLLNSPWGRKTINLKLVGKHNVYNALAAATNGLALGFNIDIIKTGIEYLNEVPRLENLITDRTSIFTLTLHIHIRRFKLS